MGWRKFADGLEEVRRRVGGSSPTGWRMFADGLDEVRRRVGGSCERAGQMVREAYHILLNRVPRGA